MIRSIHNNLRAQFPAELPKKSRKVEGKIQEVATKNILQHGTQKGEFNSLNKTDRTNFYDQHVIDEGTKKDRLGLLAPVAPKPK